MAPRILVVEDDPAILRGIELNLQLEGFDTLTATDGEAALALAEHEVDLVILDLMIPHVHGFQVCLKLRAAGNRVPIILLSARNAETDIVMGLEYGADDYVTKPFRAAELIARVKAHLRRHLPEAEPTGFADVQIDREKRLVRRAGEIVELTPREYDLLLFLVDNEGRAVTREVILAAVWDEAYIGTDRTVDNFVTRLRQKLDQPGEPAHFRTVRGVGYRFVGDGDDGEGS
jgi:two-component system, OmpR family, alkaline phosphatase synthesis response regulator PhoP